MPGLIKKFDIFASGDGIVIQSHSQAEHHHAISVNYKTQKVTKWTRPSDSTLKSETRIEAHGIVGLITIATFSFLIAITKREQVGQIFGKPVYVVTDVALLPLSNKGEADQAIVAASQAHSAHHLHSDSDLSDSEDEHQPLDTAATPGSPIEEDGPFIHKDQNNSNTSIAEDVAKRKASYGKFASQWFSRQVWGAQISQVPVARPTMPSTSVAANTNSETPQQTALKQDITADPASGPYASTVSLLPKILRSTKMILTSRSFYFAYEFDLTRRFQIQDRSNQLSVRDNFDQAFFWNRRMGSAFLESGHESFLLPIIQGFVGQRTFNIKQSVSDITVTTDTSKQDMAVDDGGQARDTTNARSYLLTIISRRSVKRSGLRYLRRGIDDEGNCANTVETEQILSSVTWDPNFQIRSFTQLRASIPLYFSQSPYSFKPVPVLHNSPAANQKAFKRHFQWLKERYGGVQAAALIDKHGTEVAIGEAYEHTYRELGDAGQMSNVSFEWFDFHAECRGMKFENVHKLVDKMQEKIEGWGETVIVNEAIQKKQEGIIRTNCMDCLDRTNVAQSAFGQYVLERDLREDGFEIDLLHDKTTNWFNTLWADNGDAISRQYASTAALKGDFTRTRKRNWRGQMNDLGLTLSRYYSNMVNDYFSQAVIDVLLGNVSWKIFEDFESTMKSADPGISVESAREAAIDNCAKIVVQDSQEDLIHGWAMLTPAQPNTLRTLPFEETVVLLTDAAIYCCKFDWNTQKVASFEKVDLRSISKIRFGTYITSTFTDHQLDEQLNQGLVIVFVPGKGDIIRVNTRSLQNSVSSDADGSTAVDGGTGIMSWFTPRNPSPAPRTLALKVITHDTSLAIERDHNKPPSEVPNAIASRISSEIERAIVGEDKAAHSGLVEEGDIINAAEAKKRTGYLERLGHSIKKMVWT